MRRSFPSRVSIVFVLVMCATFAQTPSAGPQFEVASVKPSSGPGSLLASGVTPRYTINAARVDIQAVSLELLLRMAYKVESYQISGPSWMAGTWVDIVAKPPDGSTNSQIPEMLQALLAERFKLTVHRESKEQTVYALLVGKDGPKLKEAAPDAGHSDIPFPNVQGGRMLQLVVRTEDGGYQVSVLNGRPVLEAQKITIPDLALALRRYVDAPVIDTTGLKGAYQVALEVPPAGRNAERLQAAAASAGGARGPAEEASDPSGVSIFASVQKLGLRLERRKAPVESIVVDHLEKTPTEN